LGPLVPRLLVRHEPGQQGVLVSSDVNIKTIQQVYDAFGRGDVATILEAVHDNVDWASEAASSSIAPWYGVRHGKDGVTDFFTALGATMQVEEFTPLSFAANDSDVFSVVRFRASARTTGKTATMDLHHFFTFRDGKIVYYRGTEDTAQTQDVLST
jgi:ketosteroid isomerase-like protein